MMITTDSLISVLPIFPLEISYNKKKNIKMQNCCGQFHQFEGKEVLLTSRAWSILSSGWDAKPHAYRNLSCRTTPSASVKLRNSSMASRDAAVWDDVTASTT